MHRFRHTWVAPVLAGSALVAGSLGAGAAAATHPAATPSGSGWHVKVLARAPHLSIDGQQLRLSNPDDITELGGKLFVAWQDGVGAKGQPAANGVDFTVITEYSPTGHLLDDWKLHGKSDGLTAFPAGDRVIATIDEDANTSLDTISPSARPGHQVVLYRYKPGNPRPHGGGTDAISIVDGKILISASAPGTQAVATQPAKRPALYRARLSRRAGAGTGIATLIPVFADGSTARVVNTALPTPSSLSPVPPSYCPPTPAVCTIPPLGAEATLDLTDPDSSEVVPSGSPRFAGDLGLDSQGDEQLIFMKAAGTPRPRLSVLYLSQSIDDTAYVTDPGATLYATDPAADEIVAIRGPFRRGEAIVSATPSGANNAVNAPNYLAMLSLETGTVSRIGGLAGIQSDGLLLLTSPKV